ncbi:MAG: T9SS type A sorting domain-containing protein [Candidatus Marinimicrobia bacterium]|nr:T9SS type A sorting domain-containing protein [Candidatus Neomarinimicrobiota bacterium]
MRTDSFSTIMLGFGLEALGGFDGEADPPRADVIYRMLSWLEGNLVEVDRSKPLPNSAGIIAAYPNPFNPEIQLKVQLMDGEAGELWITDLRGATVDRISVSQSGSLTWKPRNQLSSGLYFVRLMVNGEARGSWQKITFLK